MSKADYTLTDTPFRVGLVQASSTSGSSAPRAKIGLVLFAGADGPDKALVVVWHLGDGDIAPHALVEVLAGADPVAGGRAVGIDFHRALVAGDLEEEPVRMAATPAGGVDRAEGAILEFHADDGRVVRIENVFADAVAGAFGKAFRRQ